MEAPHSLPKPLSDQFPVCVCSCPFVYKPSVKANLRRTQGSAARSLLIVRKFFLTGRPAASLSTPQSKLYTQPPPVFGTSAEGEGGGVGGVRLRYTVYSWQCAAGCCARAVLVWGGASRGYTDHHHQLLSTSYF